LGIAGTTVRRSASGETKQRTAKQKKEDAVFAQVSIFFAMI